MPADAGKQQATAEGLRESILGSLGCGLLTNWELKSGENVCDPLGLGVCAWEGHVELLF
jgi:hypothetical protein